jgi:fatty-acyl-CoA synthase
MTDPAAPRGSATLASSTLPELLSHAARDGEVPFLRCPERTWTYAEFAHAVDQFASGLRELGITRGDRVAIAAPNSAEWLITWFATAKVGAILVTLNVAYREREFDFMLNQSGSVVLLTSAQDGGFDFVSFLDRLRPQIPSVRHFVFLGGAGFPGSHRWEDLRVPDDGPAADPDTGLVAPEDPAVILYTSGTTGEPKGATLTHAGILASARAQAEHLAQTSGDVAIGHMPLNHVGGLTCTVTASMVVQGSVALLPRYSPAQALNSIGRHGVTIFIGVPTMYTKMMELPEFAGMDVSSVRTCVIGGSNVEPAMGRRIIEAFDGARLANLYGLSETAGGCIISAADDDLDTLVETLGVPIGDFEVRIADDDNHALPPDADGELQIRGDCVSPGYWDLEAPSTFLPDGWLATGDMALRRPDGRVTLRGRKKEMYIRGGYNVYPAEVENVIAGEPSVAMCAVIGVPDEVNGEVGHAYVVPAAGATADPEALLDLCRIKLARYKVPARIVVVDSLPLTPSGKIKKVALRDAMVAP